MPELDDGIYLVMVTRCGIVKRMRMMELSNIKNVGIRAISIGEDDELISVRETDGEQKMLIATHDGMAICFNETDVRPVGRGAFGVKGISLRKGDHVVGAARARRGGALLTVTENGYGKRTEIAEYLRGDEGETQRRGGIGRRNYHITDKTGKVADVKVVDDNDDVLLISDDGTIIRMAAADISMIGRATQGVRLMRTSSDAKVISIARTEKDEDFENGNGDD
jgi:DNA gyrase subunit A